MREENKPIGLGLAGIGRAGWGMHCPELEGRTDKFRIVAACDVEKSRLDCMAERYGCKTYRKIEAMIADPDVELVSVATRSPEHVPHALLALEAGKHVFVEKPIATSYAEAKKLKTAAARSKGKIFVRHNRRFEPAFQHIREIIASGLLGKVYEIKLRRNGYGRRDDWQTLIRCGGGQLLNWGPHIVDHALRFLESPVAEIWSDLKKIAAVGDAEDHVKIVLRGKNGRVVDLEISGGSAIGEPTYLVTGTKGALTSDEREIRLRYLDPKKKLPPRRPKAASPPLGAFFGSPDALEWIDETIPVKSPPPGCTGNGDAIWDHLYDAIRHGKRFPITLDEALEVMRVISQAKKGTPFASRP
jgi:predicted dehydrogenase